jgi:uncharacterized membrane protein (DUF2068 family)
VTRYGPLAAATALLIGAAVELGGQDVTSPAGVALLSAGLIVLGAWLSIESYHLWQDKKWKDDRE